MRTLVIIQARIGGDRLPGKIKEVIAGRSVLEHVVARARHGGYSVVVAAPPTSVEDWSWSYEFRALNKDNKGRPSHVPVYMPMCEEGDLLRRFALTALWANDMDRFTSGEGFGCIVRLTADCPLLPVSAIDAVAEAVTSGDHDYCETRSDPSTRPNGIDAQAFTLELLREADALANEPSSREHVTAALLQQATAPGRVAQLEGIRLDDLPSFRITLDTREDLARLQRLARRVTLEPHAGRPTLTELRDLHRKAPALFI